MLHMICRAVVVMDPNQTELGSIALGRQSGWASIFVELKVGRASAVDILCSWKASAATLANCNSSYDAGLVTWLDTHLS